MATSSDNTGHPTSFRWSLVKPPHDAFSQNFKVPSLQTVILSVNECVSSDTTTHPGIVHTLDEGPGLVRGSDGGAEEPVDVDVVHLDQSELAVGRCPPDQDALVQLSLKG